MKTEDWGVVSGRRFFGLQHFSSERDAETSCGDVITMAAVAARTLRWTGGFWWTNGEVIVGVIECCR
jgi:hypothetical protein